MCSWTTSFDTNSLFKEISHFVPHVFVTCTCGERRWVCVTSSLACENHKDNGAFFDEQPTKQSLCCMDFLSTWCAHKASTLTFPFWKQSKMPLYTLSNSRIKLRIIQGLNEGFCTVGVFKNNERLCIQSRTGFSFYIIWKWIP